MGPPDGKRNLLGGRNDGCRVLLTEGSSTSARQTLYALGRLGCVIEVLDSQRLCLGRFSRLVRRVYQSPSFGREPLAYLEFLKDRLQRERYDVLFPTHDQVYLLARCREQLRPLVGLAVPEFASIEQVQNKAAFARLMTELNLPHPATSIVRGVTELRAISAFPCYVKLPFSTAGQGVWRVDGSEELQRVMADITAQTELLELVVQQPVEGAWCVAQGVFSHGQLVGSHCYRSRALGVGGSAQAREGVSHPLVVQHFAELGKHLGWHGAMHLEYFFEEATGQPTYIEANPRIGETMNATLSGVNLCELLLRVSLEGQTLLARSASEAIRPMRTHSVLMSLLALAEQGAGRTALVAELLRAWRHREIYADSQDELIRPSEDSLSLIPATAVVLQLLANPASAGRLIRGTVENYSLNRDTVEQIRRLV